MSTYEPTPQQLAAFDQQQAGMLDLIRVLADAHRKDVESGEDSRALCIAGLALYLIQETRGLKRGTEHLAALCAVAIDHIVGDVPT